MVIKEENELQNYLCSIFWKMFVRLLTFWYKRSCNSSVSHIVYEFCDGHSKIDTTLHYANALLYCIFKTVPMMLRQQRYTVRSTLLLWWWRDQRKESVDSTGTPEWPCYTRVSNGSARVAEPSKVASCTSLCAFPRLGNYRRPCNASEPCMFTQTHTRATEQDGDSGADVWRRVRRLLTANETATSSAGQVCLRCRESMSNHQNKEFVAIKKVMKQKRAHS